jgi:hypothetical protein
MNALLTANLMFVALQLGNTPQIDVIRLAPPTGIYVETDYLGDAQSQQCDWYASATTLLRQSADERSAMPFDCRLAVRVRGVLNQAGAERFAALTELLARTESVPTRVVLNSRGGDAAAAFRIATLIRAHPLYRRADGGVATVIDPAATAVCFSACLIVFAAGFERVAEFGVDGDPALPSRLGMHSPAHFDRRLSNYDTDVDNRNIQFVRQRLVHYFRSVDVSEEIVDDMFSVPFERIHLLTRSEALRYRLIVDRTGEQ